MRQALISVIALLCMLLPAQQLKARDVAESDTLKLQYYTTAVPDTLALQSQDIVVPDTLIVTRPDTLVVARPNTVIIFRPAVMTVESQLKAAKDTVPDIEVEIDSLTTLIIKKWPIVHFVQRQPAPVKTRWTLINKPRFAWGLDVGSGVDLTGSDMSSLDVNAYFGYQGPYIRFLGVGAGIDMMISSSSNSYPVYGIFRTDFQPVPQLCFLELRGGIAFSNIETYKRQSTPFGSVGVGITLAKGKTFSSHIIMSYNYTKLNDVVIPDNDAPIHIRDLQYASLRIGVTF